MPTILLTFEWDDVLLCMEWIRTLGPIHEDFSIPSIIFQHNDESITLQGDPKSTLTHTIYHQLCQLLHTNSIASMHLLSFETHDTPLTPAQTSKSTIESVSRKLPPEIKSILLNYPTVFQEPRGLPPSRLHAHHIPILPNTPPINVKPYQ